MNWKYFFLWVACGCFAVDLIKIQKLSVIDMKALGLIFLTLGHIA